jgi:hypothetical protein
MGGLVSPITDRQDARCCLKVGMEEKKDPIVVADTIALP